MPTILCFVAFRAAESGVRSTTEWLFGDTSRRGFNAAKLTDHVLNGFAID
jgi:hypothetical protein